MQIGVITFPGSLDDRDARAACELAGADAVELWHADRDLKGVDAVVLPGGFSYGDYLRTGAVAHLAPIMAAVKDFAAAGGPVLGICNGFQILCEADLLPGALLMNEGLRFVCREVEVVLEATCAWTADLPPGTRLRLPVKHGEGRYHAEPATLDRLEAEGGVLMRYAAGHNPNGSVRDIAGVVNAGRNVAGLMPHPEHATDPSLAFGTDGRRIFASVLAHLRQAPVD
ncbi:MAG: phosphoribosylformylglycinamidine synthase subunit PurQ [Actinobacteria bacterium]|nr:phosphoribosylformylglycinamidine synthase subunit PurQ [Actinomycetota bacterium]